MLVHRAPLSVSMAFDRNYAVSTLNSHAEDISGRQPFLIVLEDGKMMFCVEIKFLARPCSQSCPLDLSQRSPEVRLVFTNTWVNRVSASKDPVKRMKNEACFRGSLYCCHRAGLKCLSLHF